MTLTPNKLLMFIAAALFAVASIGYGALGWSLVLALSLAFGGFSSWCLAAVFP